MARSELKSVDSSAKVIGRPRRLTLRAVVEAASEIGLENLSMNAVAARLGVAVATIYTYVDSRDELIRLVANRRAWRPQVSEANQHWSDIVRAHVDGMYRLFSSEPSLLMQLVNGGLGPEEELDEVENFLKLLMTRGFTAADAFTVFCASSQLALGAAVGAARTLNWQLKGEPRRVKLARAFAEREPDEFPHLRELGDAYTGDAATVRYEDALALLLDQIAARRGETLPRSKTASAPAKRRRKKS
jgi:AcrR family transcriptional regulator